MNKSIALAAFRRRVLRLYRDLGRDPGTILKMDQLLGELGEVLGPAARTDHLTTEAIARWRAVYGPSRAVWTVIGQLGYLRAACSYAVEEGLLGRPPNFRRLLPKRPGPGRGLHHPLEDLRRLLDHLERRALAGAWTDRRLFALVATALLTGLRRNELLFLRQADVLLEAGIIAIVPIGERGLKTADSEQPVPIPPELDRILRDWLPVAAEHSDPDRPWLWPGERGRNAWHGGGPGRRPIDRLQAAGREVGIARITWQSLRRSWATHAETAWGLTDPQIQRVLRHTSPLTSRLHYRAADVANLRSIAERISYRT